MSFLIPSKKQWNKWSLPSKLTFVGTYAGIVGIVLTIGFFFWPTNEKPEGKANSQSAINSPNTILINAENVSNIYTAPITINASNNVFAGPVNVNLSPSEKLQLFQLLANVDRTDVSFNTNYPGYSIVLVMRLQKNNEHEKKYIIGFCENAHTNNENQMTVFLGGDNSLSLLLVDSDGYPFTLRILPESISFDQLTYFTFEAGNKGDKGFLRISTNGVPVSTLKLEHPLGLSNLAKSLSFVENPDFNYPQVQVALIFKTTYSHDLHDTVVKACSYIVDKN